MQISPYRLKFTFIFFARFISLPPSAVGKRRGCNGCRQFKERKKKKGGTDSFRGQMNWKLAYLSLLKQLRLVLIFIPNATRERRIRSKTLLKCRTNENNERVERWGETEGREKNLEGGDQKLQKQRRGWFAVVVVVHNKMKARDKWKGRQKMNWKRRDITYMKNEKKKLIVENLSSIITTGKIKENFYKKKSSVYLSSSSSWENIMPTYRHWDINIRSRICLPWHTVG